jgi:hypothetical protein
MGQDAVPGRRARDGTAGRPVRPAIERLALI